MSDELRGLDRYLEREPENAPVPSAGPRVVWCRACQREDESANQRRCRRCGSPDIERVGGVTRRRRQYDE